jgi:bifunctional non-homologous end joining protein LigD
VATPLHWEELSDDETRPDRWTLASVPERLGRDGDPWRDMARRAQTIGAARRRLDQALADRGLD